MFFDKNKIEELAEEQIYADSRTNKYTHKDRYLFDYGRGLKGLGDKDLMTLLDRGAFNSPGYDSEMYQFDKDAQIRNLLENMAFDRGAQSTDEGTYIPPVEGNQFTGAGPGRWEGRITESGDRIPSHSYLHSSVQKGKAFLNLDIPEGQLPSYQLHDTDYPFNKLAEVPYDNAHSMIDSLINENTVSTEETAPLMDLLEMMQSGDMLPSKPSGDNQAGLLSLSMKGKEF